MAKVGRPNKYDFAGMKVGDKITVPASVQIYPAWLWYKKYHKLKWKMRQRKEGDKLIFERIK